MRDEQRPVVPVHPVTAEHHARIAHAAVQQHAAQSVPLEVVHRVVRGHDRGITIDAVARLAQPQAQFLVLVDAHFGHETADLLEGLAADERNAAQFHPIAVGPHLVAVRAVGQELAGR